VTDMGYRCQRGVDVVVVNYHTPELLADFVRSYQAHRFGVSTLTVINVEEAEGPLPPEVETADVVEWVEQNIGYGAACNLGLSLPRPAPNRVVLLANADTFLTAGLEECVKNLLDEPEWGILGPRQVDSRGFITAGGIFGPPDAPKLRGWHQPDNNGLYGDVRSDALTVSGSLYFIKRSVAEELTECELFQKVQPGATGPFLETPHYYEETWCSYHAREHGYKCVYYGPVTMWHHWHKSSPVGGYAEHSMAFSRGLYKEACAVHEICCEP